MIVKHDLNSEGIYRLGSNINRVLSCNSLSFKKSLLREFKFACDLLMDYLNSYILPSNISIRAKNLLVSSLLRAFKMSLSATYNDK